MKLRRPKSSRRRPEKAGEDWEKSLERRFARSPLTGTGDGVWWDFIDCIGFSCAQDLHMASDRGWTGA